MKQPGVKAGFTKRTDAYSVARFTIRRYHYETYMLVARPTHSAVSLCPCDLGAAFRTLKREEEKLMQRIARDNSSRANKKRKVVVENVIH